MKTKEPKEKQPIPIPEGLEARLSAAIDGWEAREKAARRRRRHALGAVAAGLAAAAVMAGLVFMARRPQATLPEVAQTVPPQARTAARPLKDTAAAPLAPSRAVAAMPAPPAAPERVHSARPAAPKRKAQMVQAPAPQQAEPAETRPEPTAKQLAAVQKMLNDYLADQERQRMLIEDVMRNFEEIENNPIAYSI